MLPIHVVCIIYGDTPATKLIEGECVFTTSKLCRPVEASNAYIASLMLIEHRPKG